MRMLLWLTFVSFQAVSARISSGDITAIHENGRCAIRGQCGTTGGFFGSPLPCPDNGKAEEPDDAVRKQIVEICGDKWNNGPVCCEESQLEPLKSNLKRADAIIGACPACRENFFNLWCEFTCSPNQSTFLNVTETKEASGNKSTVEEVGYFVSEEYGSGFFDSCKDVKFSATNGFAMDLIAGGAKNYTSFLKFLGDKKFLGSPFQIDFPKPEKESQDGIKAMSDHPIPCNSSDPKYKCSCVDCEGSCVKPLPISQGKECKVGVLPCLSFASIIVYSVFVLLAISGLVFHVLWQKHTQRKSERMRLLQDSAPSDDEDEGDMVHNAGMFDRPQRSYKVNTLLDKVFGRLGRLCGRYPAITIAASIIVIVLLSIGWIHFSVETDPVKLWVSPSSPAAKEKEFFDENFGPFYRTEQVFVVNETSSDGPSPAMSFETLSWWFSIEDEISTLKTNKSGIQLDDICFKPTGDACVVESVSGYFAGQKSSFTPQGWAEKVLKCSQQPVNCLPPFLQPLKPNLLFGGIPANDSVLEAQAFVITWVVNNRGSGTEEQNTAAAEWEESLKHVLLKAKSEAKKRGLSLAFSTGISLEQELNKSTNTDAKIVVISYVVMFLYVAIALGSSNLGYKTLIHYPSIALIQSKFSLAIIGIVIVLMSVSASVGLFSAFGIKVTLIIAEVIPFLVLAIGVDNIFLIVHEFERVNLSHPDDSVDVRMGKALGRMGPSILLSALAETAAFALGAAVGMPAVKNFAIYAAGAVVINALLQVTMFVAVLALNQRRVEDSRADCMPCIQFKKFKGRSNESRLFETDVESNLQKFIRKVYAPNLLAKKAKAIILFLFLSIFAAGVALIPEVSLGLDQKIAIPSGSYLIEYFSDVTKFLDVGPPVYFVSRDLNDTQRLHQQQLCGRFSTCHPYSLTNVIEQERKRPEQSYISEPAASWIDDYFEWLNPVLEDCCVEGGKVCFADRNPPWNSTLHGMPIGEDFIHYLEKWIQDPPSEDCPIAGKAAFGDAVVIDAENVTIPASNFRSSHTPLRSQEDFINAYKSARRISGAVNDVNEMGDNIFPYSVFYIFFDQYITIVRTTGVLLGAAIALIMVISTFLLGSLRTGLVVTVTVIMIVVDIIGTMALFNVSLNAVSLVNLIICVGIAVEFCAHIARAFMFPSRTVMERARNKFRAKDARAWTALVNVGGSVFSGITITKLLGVCVLAFTRSKIFEIYYFRIWLALVIFAATHALIFLPVALSIFGGDGYTDPASDGGLEEDLASRRYRALIPDDNLDSEDDF